MAKRTRSVDVDPALVLDRIVAEHAQEASFVWLQRAQATSAPNYSPRQFSELDDRLEAHIDGLRVAASQGWLLATAELDAGGAEAFFAPAVLALESADGRFAEVLEAAEASGDAMAAVISSLGWVEARFLGGRVNTLLAADSSYRQVLAIAACAVHRRDPGSALDRALTSRYPAVRARALRSAAEVGRTDLLPHVMTLLEDPKREARFWAAWSSVLLGDRGKGLDSLVMHALQQGPRQLKSMQLALQAMEVQRGHELLLQCGDLPAADRLRVIGAGYVGSSRYVPWLIEQMADAALARVAGEAFVNITGADFTLDQLEAMPPDDFEDGPTEDPADENVAVPEDIALPWPDVPRVKAWWNKNVSRFDASTRYFLGAPVNTPSCTNALKTGFQRQRVTAARYLTLLNPGVPLFNTSAPARRQQAVLAKVA